MSDAKAEKKLTRKQLEARLDELTRERDDERKHTNQLLNKAAAKIKELDPTAAVAVEAKEKKPKKANAETTDGSADGGKQPRAKRTKSDKPVSAEHELFAKAGLRDDTEWSKIMSGANPTQAAYRSLAGEAVAGWVGPYPDPDVGRRMAEHDEIDGQTARNLLTAAGVAGGYHRQLKQRGIIQQLDELKDRMEVDDVHGAPYEPKWWTGKGQWDYIPVGDWSYNLLPEDARGPTGSNAAKTMDLREDEGHIGDYHAWLDANATDNDTEIDIPGCNGPKCTFADTYKLEPIPESEIQMHFVLTGDTSWNQRRQTTWPTGQPGTAPTSSYVEVGHYFQRYVLMQLNVYCLDATASMGPFLKLPETPKESDRMTAFMEVEWVKSTVDTYEVVEILPNTTWSGFTTYEGQFPESERPQVAFWNYVDGSAAPSGDAAGYVDMESDMVTSHRFEVHTIRQNTMGITREPPVFNIQELWLEQHLNFDNAVELETDAGRSEFMLNPNFETSGFRFDIESPAEAFFYGRCALSYDDITLEQVNAHSGSVNTTDYVPYTDDTSTGEITTGDLNTLVSRVHAQQKNYLFGRYEAIGFSPTFDQQVAKWTSMWKPTLAIGAITSTDPAKPANWSVQDTTGNEALNTNAVVTTAQTQEKSLASRAVGMADFGKDDFGVCCGAPLFYLWNMRQWKCGFRCADSPTRRTVNRMYPKTDDPKFWLFGSEDRFVGNEYIDVGVRAWKGPWENVKRLFDIMPSDYQHPASTFYPISTTAYATGWAYEENNPPYDIDLDQRNVKSGPTDSVDTFERSARGELHVNEIKKYRNVDTLKSDIVRDRDGTTRVVFANKAYLLPRTEQYYDKIAHLPAAGNAMASGRLHPNVFASKISEARRHLVPAFSILPREVQTQSGSKCKLRLSGIVGQKRVAQNEPHGIVSNAVLKTYASSKPDAKETMKAKILHNAEQVRRTRESMPMVRKHQGAEIDHTVATDGLVYKRADCKFTRDVTYRKAPVALEPEQDVGLAREFLNPAIMTKQNNANLNVMRSVMERVLHLFERVSDDTMDALRVDVAANSSRVHRKRAAQEEEDN